MAATYTMQEMKDLHNENETILYPRMIIKGQCSTEELIEDIAHHTTYNTGELRQFQAAAYKLKVPFIAKRCAGLS